MATVSMETVLPRSAPMKWCVLSVCDHIFSHSHNTNTSEIYCKRFYSHCSIYRQRANHKVQHGYRGIVYCLHKDISQVRQQKYKY